MQQTDKYKFNLIEKEDTFSPDPLNENMEKLEGALEEARAEAAALDQRLQVFEARRMVVGTYTPAQTALDIDLGFTPKAVLILAVSDSVFSGMLVPDAAPRYDAALTAAGFQIAAAGGGSSSAILNRSGVSFAYLALG